MRRFPTALQKVATAVGAALAAPLTLVGGALGVALTKTWSNLSPIWGRGGWQTIIREPFSGAWQQNKEMTQDTILAFSPLFACLSLIATDIGKLRWMLREQDAHGIWNEVKTHAWGALLRKPNRYQNALQFRQWWVMSKLLAGNVYILKQRDARGVVQALYILDPTRVQPLVTDEGDIYYALSQDILNLQESIVVPASEIIHDRMNCLFHPLVGVSPLYAAALPAAQGLGIQIDSKNFFQNGGRPSGILTAPGAISDETANRLAAQWNDKFGGGNSGKVAVLGDNLKFEPMKFTSVEAQLIEQLKLSAEWVCTALHVPAFKIGAGSLPAGQKVDAMNLLYYTDCLQGLIEDMEQCLADGLELAAAREIYVDVDGLLRMDAQTLFATLGEGVKNVILAPNEARRRANLPPVAGGDAPLAQQQNYSLAALAKRDAKPDPFVRETTATRADVTGANPDAVAQGEETPPAATPAPTPAPAGKAQVAEAEALAHFLAVIKNASALDFA